MFVASQSAARSLSVSVFYDASAAVAVAAAAAAAGLASRGRLLREDHERQFLNLSLDPVGFFAWGRPERERLGDCLTSTARFTAAQRNQSARSKDSPRKSRNASPISRHSVAPL